MMMKYAALMLAAPIALATAAAPAEAAIFSFDLSGSYQATFDIDDAQLMPPAESGADYFLVTNVKGMFGGVRQTATSIQFSTLSADGGFTIGLADGDFRGFFGAPLFAGTTTMPAISTGLFTLTSDIDGAPASLAISAVPEPATWGMMVAGFAAVGLSLRRRRATRADAVTA